jgi:hypothetical protein
MEAAQIKGGLARPTRSPIPGLDPCLTILDVTTMTGFLDAPILTSFLWFMFKKTPL